MGILDYGIAAGVGLLTGLADAGLYHWIDRHGQYEQYAEKPGKKKVRLWLWMPVVMMLTAVYLLWVTNGWTYLFGVELLLCAYLLPLAVFDYRYKMLPDMLHVIYGILFLAFHLLFGSWYDLLNGIIAAAVILLILGLVHLVKKDQFGLGDVKLLGVCAFLVGIPGIMYLFLRGLLVGAVYSAVQIFRHRADLKTELPLVPFLFVGALL